MVSIYLYAVILPATDIDAAASFHVGVLGQSGEPAEGVILVLWPNV
jgi:hypothetical protein